MKLCFFGSAYSSMHASILRTYSYLSMVIKWQVMQKGLKKFGA